MDRKKLLKENTKNLKLGRNSQNTTKINRTNCSRGEGKREERREQVTGKKTDRM